MALNFRGSPIVIQFVGLLQIEAIPSMINNARVSRATYIRVNFSGLDLNHEILTATKFTRSIVVCQYKAS